MFNKAASSIEVEHTQVRRLVGSHVQQGSQQYRGRTHSGIDWWDHMFNKAASSIEVEHTQVRRLEGSHVQQGSQQYRGNI